MRLVQISVVMASVSLAAAVVLYLKVDRLERDLGGGRAVARESRGGEGPAAVDAARYELPPRAVEGESQLSAGDSVLGGGPGSAVAGARRPATIEDRLTRLEEQQKALQSGAAAVPWHGRAQTFARNVDDLAQHLSLTPTQRSRVEDVVARGKQRIEDVLKIPDETGKSPYERRTEARQKLQEAMKTPQPGGFLALATDLTSYHGRKIPGRNDTYGDEIRRIRKETRDEISAALDSKQQESFAQTNVDGLLGDTGQVSFAYAVGDVADGASSGLVIEMEADGSTDETPAEDVEEAPGNR